MRVIGIGPALSMTEHHQDVGHADRAFMAAGGEGGLLAGQHRAELVEQSLRGGLACVNSYCHANDSIAGEASDVKRCSCAERGLSAPLSSAVDARPPPPRPTISPCDPVGGVRSPWLRDALAAEGDPPPLPGLSRDRSCDVAIVGGGYTGLWTAIRLTELAPGARRSSSSSRTSAAAARQGRTAASSPAGGTSCTSLIKQLSVTRRERSGRARAVDAAVRRDRESGTAANGDRRLVHAEPGSMIGSSAAPAQDGAWSEARRSTARRGSASATRWRGAHPRGGRRAGPLAECSAKARSCGRGDRAACGAGAGHATGRAGRWRRHPRAEHLRGRAWSAAGRRTRVVGRRPRGTHRLRPAR